MKKVLFLASLLTLQFDGTLAMRRHFVPGGGANAAAGNRNTRVLPKPQPVELSVPPAKKAKIEEEARKARIAEEKAEKERLAKEQAEKEANRLKAARIAETARKAEEEAKIREAAQIAARTAIEAEKARQAKKAEEEAAQKATNVGQGLAGESEESDKEEAAQVAVNKQTKRFSVRQSIQFTETPNQQNASTNVAPENMDGFRLNALPTDGINEVPSSRSRNVDSRAGRRLSEEGTPTANSLAEQLEEIDNGLSDDALDVFGRLWPDMTKEQLDDIQSNIEAAVSTSVNNTPRAFIDTLNAMKARKPLMICEHLERGSFNDNCKVLVPDLKKAPYTQIAFCSVEGHFMLTTSPTTQEDIELQQNRLRAFPAMIEDFYMMQPNHEGMNMETINYIVARYLSALKIVRLLHNHGLYDDDVISDIFTRAIEYADALERANTGNNQYAIKLIAAIRNCCPIIMLPSN